jgi:hypothetical protein
MVIPRDDPSPGEFVRARLGATVLGLGCLAWLRTFPEVFADVPPGNPTYSRLLMLDEGLGLLAVAAGVELLYRGRRALLAFGAGGALLAYSALMLCWAIPDLLFYLAHGYYGEARPHLPRLAFCLLCLGFWPYVVARLFKTRFRRGHVAWDCLAGGALLGALGVGLLWSQHHGRF